jgi:hypothetical protein
MKSMVSTIAAMIQRNIRDSELAFKSLNFPTARPIYMSATYDQPVLCRAATPNLTISRCQTSRVPHLHSRGARALRTQAGLHNLEKQRIHEKDGIDDCTAQLGEDPFAA